MTQKCDNTAREISGNSAKRLKPNDVKCKLTGWNWNRANIWPKYVFFWMKILTDRNVDMCLEIIERKVQVVGNSAKPETEN